MISDNNMFINKSIAKTVFLLIELGMKLKQFSPNNFTWENKVWKKKEFCGWSVQV